MKRRILSTLLTLALTLSLVPAAHAAGVGWKLTGGTLVFYGSGSTFDAFEMWKKGTAGRATGVEIQAGVTEIHDGAFSGMAKLSKVVMADTVTSIGRYAFNNCPELSDITIPAKVTFLGDYAFKNCTELERVTLPQSLKRVEQGAFSGCTRLKEVQLGSDVFYIGAGAFTGCMRLPVFAVPERVTKVYPETFAHCSGLVQIYLPAGLERIYADSFANCNSLTDIYFSGTAEQWQKVVKEDDTVKSSHIAVHYNAKASDLDKNAQGAGETSLLFDDVMPDYWGYNSIMTIAKHGLVSGTRAPDATGVGSFTPEGKVTLGQFLVVITRLVCPEARKDTPGHWARGSYNAALETGIIAKGDFSDADQTLDAPLNRQNMAYILVRAARLQGESFTVHPDTQKAIKDSWRIEENRKQAVLECYSSGIISGYGDGSFGPEKTMTRAQMAVVVCRLAGWQPRAEVKM